MASQLEQVDIPVIEPSKYIRLLQRIPVVGRFAGTVATIIYLMMTFCRVPADITCFYLPSSYFLGMIAAALTGNDSKTIMFRRSLNNYQHDRYLTKKYEIWLHKRVDMIVGNSQAVVNQLSNEEHVPVDKMKLIYNGINISGSRANLNSHKIRKELGIDTGTLVLTIVANLIPYKGHIDLIHALSSIKNSLEMPWILLVVGRGVEKRQDLLELVSDCNIKDHVHWLGLRHDVVEIFAESDIGLLVSHQESFSNAILEGMASGIPMIVTNVGGNSEAVVHENCGLVVAPHHPEQLASAILKLSENELLRRKYGENARIRVMSEFNNELCLERYIDLFKSPSQAVVNNS